MPASQILRGTKATQTAIRLLRNITICIYQRKNNVHIYFVAHLQYFCFVMMFLLSMIFSIVTLYYIQYIKKNLSNDVGICDDFVDYLSFLHIHITKSRGFP